MEEQEKKTTENNNEKKKKPEKKKVIWGQLRVPNIKKGSNPNIPYIMMGVVAVIFVLSFIFAKLSS